MHLLRSEFHCLVNLQVPGAATKITRQRLLNFSTRRIRCLLQQLFSDEQKTGRTVTTLGCAEIRKRLLQRVKLSTQGHPLDRLDLAILGIESQHQARQNRAPVYQYGTRPAFAEFTTVLRSREIEILTQNLEQRLVRGEGDFDVFAIEGKPDLFLTVERHRLSS